MMMDDCKDHALERTVTSIKTNVCYLPTLPWCGFPIIFFIIAAQTSWTMVLYTKLKRLADILRWDGSRDGATTYWGSPVFE